MKTAIKLALIYLAMQILGALAVGPFTMIYAYVKYGTVDRASEFALAPTLLAGFVFMLIYLWQKASKASTNVILARTLPQPREPTPVLYNSSIGPFTKAFT